jgi:hypothetical protein
VAQEGKYLYEIEIERIQSLMGVYAVNEQINVGNLLTPIGGMGGLLKTFNWFSTFNKHDWLTFVDIISGVLGMFPTPAAPIFLGVSLAACHADGALYFAENDPYMGGLILSFCLIPLGEFIRYVPGAKNIISKGKQYCIDLLKKAKSLSGKKVLDAAEKKIVQEAELLIKEISKKSDEIAKLTQKYFVSRVISNIIKTGGKLLHGTALLLSKMSWAIGKPIIQLGGIYYTYDEIYLAMYATDEQKIKLRNNSAFQQLVRMVKLLTNQETIDEQFGKMLKDNEDTIKNNPELLGEVDPVKKQAAIDENCRLYAEYLQEQEKIKQTSKNSPSIEDVISKKIDPTTKQPYKIIEGQKGESVTKIQEMLVKLDYGSTLKGYNDEKKGVDGHFGENTYNAVAVFQSNNGLESTGEVDSETLKVIKSKLQELGK